MTYTFSDGLTLAGTNVTNDLVTGEEVAHVNAQTASGASLEITDTGEVEITSASVDLAAINLNAGAGGFLAANGSGSRFVLGVAGDVQVTAAGGVGGDLTLAASHDLLVPLTRDEIHTIGRNLSFQVAGAGGASIDAAAGNVDLHAGSGVGDTGVVRIQPTAGAPAATRKVQFFNGAGSSQVTIDTGVSDSFTIGQICDLLFALGLITNPSP